MPPVGRDVTLVPLEFRQDDLIRTPHRVRQHIQAATMRHAEHDVADARLAGELDHQVEHRHHDVDAFDREALGAEICLVEKAFHALNRRQPRQQHLRLVRSEGAAMHTRLDLLAQPEAPFVRREVFHFVGNRTAVRLLQVRQRIDQGGARHADAEDSGRNRRHDLRCQSQRRGVERRITRRLRAERIERCGQVAVGPECFHQSHRCGDVRQRNGVAPERNEGVPGRPPCFTGFRATLSAAATPS